MRFTDVLAADPGLTIVGTVVGGIWSLFKSTELFGRWKKRRYYRALTALEAAVEYIYRQYVASIKKDRQDGKLTDAEKRHARRLAREAAIKMGRTQGVNVLKELGEDYLDMWIAKAVKKAKSQ